MKLWRYFAGVNAGTVMLLAVLGLLLVYWKVGLPDSRLPAETYQVVGPYNNIHKPTRRKFSARIEWQPAVEVADNPFSSVFLSNLAREHQKAERERQREKQKARTNPQPKPRPKPQPEPEQDPFIVRTITLAYRGLLTGTDSRNVAILELPSGEVTHATPQQTIAKDIIVQSFTPSRLQVTLPNGTNAVIEAGQKKTISYRIPREK